MPLSSVAITGDIADQVGSDFDSRRTKIWVTTNVPDNTVIDTDGNQIRLGSGTVALNSDGTFSASVWVPGTGSSPASWQTYFHVDYPDAATRTRRTRTFGPFTITAAADLADLVEQQEVPPTYLSTVTAQLQTYVDEAEAARDTTVDISGISTSDDVVSTLISDPVAGPLTTSALTASFVPKWEASTAYTAGDVRLIQGMVGSRRTTGTSSATTDAANWQIGTEPGNVPNVKPSTDTRAGVWELTHSSDTGYLYHLLAGSSFANPAALIALGMDNGNGTGLLVANKASGVGITLRQQATIASSTAYALKVDGLSTTAPSVRIEQNVGGAGDALQLLAFSSGGAPTANQRLLYVSDPNGEAWSIFASDGRMRGQRSLRLFANPGTAAESYLEMSTSTAANSSNTRKAYHASNGYFGFGSTGSAGVYYPYSIFHQSSAMSLRVAANLTAADASNPLPTEVGSWLEVITLRYSGGARQLGFFGKTPAAQPAAIAAPAGGATIDTEARAAIDSIRSALNTLGLTA